MAAKKPTGEFPKRNSSLAKFIAGTKSNQLNMMQSRVAAGKYRDIVKATGARGLDATGVALGKAVKATQKPVKATPARGAKSLVPVKPARPARPAATTRQVGKAKPIAPAKPARPITVTATSRPIARQLKPQPNKSITRGMNQAVPSSNQRVGNVGKMNTSPVNELKKLQEMQRKVGGRAKPLFPKKKAR
jgi:hypothetical protein